MQDFHHNRARSLLANAEELYDQETVQAAVRRMAGALNDRYGDASRQEFPLVLGVMGGAVVFTGNILPQLTFPLEFDYIHVSRYGDDDQGGKVVWKVVPRPTVSGRTVIVLDDILDEGETLAHVKERLLEMGAKEVIIAVFCDKDIGKVKPVKADLVGITIPNRFVVGFGMDAYGYWRNLPGLWAINPDDLSTR
ncbi:hypoxanthine-guanine phosphoribosyltransferase [Pseudoduganella sp. DS3]|uniref:Hypoxanthine-guanine phosphoribosyltransferase n=1 Tax=Pseudoduganella guangdongensis TaxID=2692179 RepID=A0A6N9HCS7_9BURK|nr:hypoxanthine-guanine phosphoribosyltransferase [Pseudoduganella guangdongensis]MYN01249.1 hypoxanthine-guanine phosphoribosyltransferase [Pseudoduganella guangdongensis]